MFAYILLFFHYFIACSALSTAVYSTKVVSIDEWTVSDQVQIKAISTVHCGILCMNKYEKDRSCSAITFDQENSLCTAARLAYFTSLKVAWASSIYGGLNAGFAIDRNYQTGTLALKNIFRSQKEFHPWFAVDLLRPHSVTSIRIVERTDENADRTRNIEARVGDCKPYEAGTNVSTIFTINSVCGTFDGPGVVGTTSVITCSTPLIGRYVTLQRLSTESTTEINWSKIFIDSKVFTEW